MSSEADSSADRPRALQVVIAEDAVLLRQGLVELLHRAGIGVVGEVGEPEALLRRVAAARPDVALVDIRMPPTHTDEGLRAAERIRSEHPSTGVLVLSQYLNPAYAMRLLQSQSAGVGYLLKERVSDVSVLVEALERVADGECVVDPAIVARLMRRPIDGLGALTEREREVLALLAEGRSNRAIADHLFLSEKTIEAHIHKIFGKLRLSDTPADHRRVLAVLAYLRA